MSIIGLNTYNVPIEIARSIDINYSQMQLFCLTESDRI